MKPFQVLEPCDEYKRSASSESKWTDHEDWDCHYNDSTMETQLVAAAPDVTAIDYESFLSRQDMLWNAELTGTIKTSEGENRLRLTIESERLFTLSAIELIQPHVRERELAEALALRQAPEWFKDAGYGLMFQWTNRATPPTGSIKPWE